MDKLFTLFIFGPGRKQECRFDALAAIDKRCGGGGKYQRWYGNAMAEGNGDESVGPPYLGKERLRRVARFRLDRIEQSELLQKGALMRCPCQHGDAGRTCIRRMNENIVD